MEKINNNKYYHKNSQLAEKFLQVPWFLLKSKYYRDLSSDAKLAYALLKDRFEESYENNWVDDNDRIYFIFTNENLGEILNLKKNKVVSVKKELIAHGLLEVVKRGFNHEKGKNEASWLYLLKPDLQATDMYKKAENTPSTLQPHGSLKSKLPEDIPSTLQPSGSLNFKLPENGPSALQPSGSLKSKLDLEDNNYRDTIEILEDTHQEKKLSTEKQIENNIPTFDIFSSETNLWLQKISDNTNLTISELKNVIFTAKGKALKDTGLEITTVLDIKDFKNFITKTIKGLVKAIKTGKVKNIKGYLYISIYKGFSKYASMYNYGLSEQIFDYTDKITEVELNEFYLEIDGATLYDIGAD